MNHGRLAVLGAFVHRHRGRVVIGWVVALVAILALSPMLKGSSDADFETKGSESARALAVLARFGPRVRR